MESTKHVIITVRGGVAEVQEKAAGVTVEIRDYDADGAREDRLTEDENGDMYISSFYEDWQI